MSLDARFTGRRGGFTLDVALTADDSKVTALFGRSGSGKTSTLRAIAGLDRLAGECRLDGEMWQDARTFVPTHRRAIGYVFQEASLFPHLSVRQNLEFGLRRARSLTLIGFDDAVSLLGIARLLGRAPPTLSGGERQRVALGRALLSQPKLLLLDEPLSGLDRQAKDEILPYFEALHRTLSIPVLLVTHDIGEVERLADDMVLLEGGRVAAQGPLNDMLVDGAPGLWQSRDAATVLTGRLAGYDSADGLSDILVGGQIVSVVGRVGMPGDRVRVRIAARDVSLAVERPSATSILNVLITTIVAIEALPHPEAVVTLQLGDDRVLARLTTRSVRQLGLSVGQKVYAQVKGVSLVGGPGR